MLGHDAREITSILTSVNVYFVVVVVAVSVIQPTTMTNKYYNHNYTTHTKLNINYIKTFQTVVFFFGFTKF